MNNMAKIIKAERTSKNLTQNEVATLLGVTQDSISLWENGRRIPDTQYLKELCKIFDISADYLLGLEDDFGERVSLIHENATNYTTEEQELIKNFRKLNYYKQQLIKNNIKAMLPAEAESKQNKNKA